LENHSKACVIPIVCTPNTAWNNSEASPALHSSVK
jgi:hypothetical protein